MWFTLSCVIVDQVPDLQTLTSARSLIEVGQGGRRGGHYWVWASGLHREVGRVRGGGVSLMRL